MKTILSLLLIFPLLTYAQNEKIVYKDGILTFLFLTDNRKEIILEKNMGQHATVTYDPFYKSYKIFCTVEDGYSTFDLQYIQTFKDGTLRYKNKDVEHPESELYYHIEDNMAEDGILMVTKEEKMILEGKTKKIMSIGEYFFSKLKRSNE